MANFSPRSSILKCANTRYYIPVFVVALWISLVCPNIVSADQLLMTLSVENAVIRWHDDFILTLEIFGPPNSEVPTVSIDGLDQFRLNSQGKNLLQIPEGKTVKWILTYNLTAMQDGILKLGPAKTIVKGRHFSSNTLFITVHSPDKKKTVEESSVPIVHSAAEIGDKILIQMETNKHRPYRSEGTIITVHLLTQLPVESLRFKDEADFPGFIKYDFPFTSNPKAQRTKHGKANYFIYELQKFLIFPLKDGNLTIPSVTCELKVRVPSGTYAAADLMLDTVRTSNALSLKALPVSGSAIVGSFVLRNQVVGNMPQAKIVHLVLEGEGLLATFEFPLIESPHFRTRTLSTTTKASIRGQGLVSSKTTELEITPISKAGFIELPEVRISQFDPASRRFSILALPSLPLQFTLEPLMTKASVPLPGLSNKNEWILFYLLSSSVLICLLYAYWPKRKTSIPRLSSLLKRKNPKLQISKNAAQKLYQQIIYLISERDVSEVTLMETLRQHLPVQETTEVEQFFLKLETIAFAQSKAASLSYGEMKAVCERIERRWTL